MFATAGHGCAVQFFKTYLAHRPEEMRNSGPCYLALIEKPKSEVWCKKQRMGVNKIDSFMKNMALIAELDIKARKLTNHSVRKTIVKKLKVSNQPRSAINGVTGHEKRAFTRTLLISSSVCQEVQFVHSAHPYSDSSLLKSSSPFSRLLGDDSWCWEKLIRGAAVTTKTVI